MVNIMFVVLELVCQIWITFSEAKRRSVSLNGLHDFHDFHKFWIL